MYCKEYEKAFRGKEVPGPGSYESHTAANRILK